ncbi:MAG: hypothetical protein KDA97_10020 [Acidimicrobiales bacterium]|nr:hypothetical protein [Acidimicrobiales bacterium]
MAKPIALWSTPRSVSTAFDKMMRGRGDHRVFTEPFSQPYYFGPDRCSERFEPDPSLDTTNAQVWEAIDDAASQAAVFVKEMPHQLGHDLGPDALERFTSSFLIRDPAWSVPSCLAMWPDATDTELGYEAQRMAFDLVADQQGEPPPVIDATDLRADPDAVVAAWCQEVGVDHRPESLRWEAGMPDDWALWESWFTRAAASTEFAPPDDRPAPEVDTETSARIAECQAHYEHLRAHALG